MGKSRLLYEFRQRVGRERAFILSGTCSPDGQQTPFLALEYSEQSLAMTVSRLDQILALSSKGSALVLLRRTDEGAALLEEVRRDCIAKGHLFNLTAFDGIIGVCKVICGDIFNGLQWIEDAILQREKEGSLRAADWYRLLLSEVYLQIIGGNEKPLLSVLLRNLPVLVRVRFTAPSRIRSLMIQVLKNKHFDPAGLHVARAQMILGLLYKIKKQPARAVQHLIEAQRILVQFGQTPILARAERALAELRA